MMHQIGVASYMNQP